MNGGVTNGAIVAFKVVDQGNGLTLQPAWASRDIPSASSPIVVNGVVFALASGGQRAGPAVLYALDGLTGKELWNSGTTIASFVSSGGLAGGDGQVYVPTYDNTLYAFGIPLEH
jgi:outer membrane protein assembly factor BamB